MQIDNVDELTTAPLTPNSPITLIDINNQSPDGFASSFSSGSSDTISGKCVFLSYGYDHFGAVD